VSPIGGMPFPLRSLTCGVFLSAALDGGKILRLAHLNRSRRTAHWLLVALATLATLAVIVAGAVVPSAGAASSSAFVAPSLLAQAQADPSAVFKVIVQGSGPGNSNGNGAAAAIRAETASDSGNAVGLKRQLATISGASAELTGKQLLKLARMPGITAITADAPVRLSAVLSNKQQWPYVSGVAEGWPAVSNGKLPQPPTIAIVDSGIDTSRPDFGGRVIKQVTMTSLPGNSPGDGYGHGTFVAGVAAGSASGYTGAAPSAKLLSLDVMDDQGMAMTSDVIAAADWIYQNKTTYNIRVANFSLHSTAPASVFWDPLDRAVEKLWFSGVVVVAASGNYAVNGQPSGVLYAPGNDPFIITVGANDPDGSIGTKDDIAAPWSAYGYTLDGFAKPEIAAPGRYMVGPTSPTGTLALTRPGSVVAPGYIQLSGTSFAAPVAAGTAAVLLALHPEWTPDQVKGALMLTAKPTPSAAPLSTGVGEVDASRALKASDPPNPNLALDRFLTPDPNGGPTPVFDAASWGSAARTDASWGAASWGAASWGAASWGAASWGAASWGTASWGTASWGTASWGDASWGTASWGDTTVADNAGDELGPVPLLTPAEEAQAEAELGITINEDGSISGPDLAP
jgi:serine protease AprX